MTTANQEGPAARPHATAKHTPGPWEIEEGRDGAFEIHARMPSGLFNVVCARAAWTSPERQQTSIANAKLIAAAPALADALAEYIKEIEHYDWPSVEWSDANLERMRAALRAAGRLP